MISFVKTRKYLSITIIVVLIAGGYYWYAKSKSTSTAVQYKTAVAEKGTLAVSVSGSGNVIVDSSANVDPTISGTVKNLAVSVGDKVEKGQLLFEIDNDDLAANTTKAYSSYLQALSSLETAKAGKKEAKNNYDDASGNDKSLYKKKLNAAEISVDVAEQNIKYALENLQNERKNYSESKVTAPIAGTVNEINIKNGDDLSKLSSGSSREVPIIIGDLGTMKAQVAVSEVDISSVKIGQAVTLTFNAIDNFTATGKVEKMDSLGTLSSGVVSYNVIINFDSLDSRIKPEMSVSAAILTDSRDGVVIVPSSAVKTMGSKSYVEVLENKLPVKKNVETGLENNSKTEIKSGISAGESVITQTISSSSGSSSSSSNSNSRRGMGIPGM